ncbi:hypothetical protein HPP92_022081 [Vanilla planifolia]|uniref:Glycosyltransferase n=1 Tax=Vanilla planifolia TaxID=51239 RepID=A0A835UBK8_VANPL|nr:hypothetical protein HPP92_022081 [Vanilla planifolia]
MVGPRTSHSDVGHRPAPRRRRLHRYRSYNLRQRLRPPWVGHVLLQWMSTLCHHPLPVSCHHRPPRGLRERRSPTVSSIGREILPAAKLLRPSLESVLRGLAPPPSAIIFGIGFPWLASLARDALPVPRFVFHGFSSFTLLASHNLHAHKTHERAGSPTDTLILPGLPHRVEIQRSRLPIFFDRASEIHSVYVEMRDGEVAADGFVVNSFEELEQGYAALLAMAAGKKVWSVGPVSLCNRESADVASRGGRSFSVDVDRCVKWLDSRERGSVVYVSFGSMGRLDAEQTRELGLGLMASGWPFVWVIREGAPPPPPEVEKTMEESGLVIRGWAPQTIFLAHSAVGGFLTHCGWNSVMEGVVAGVPMATWPLGADQFLNEKLVVEVLRLGVEVRGEEPPGVDGKEEEVKRVVEELMVRGPEGDQRRKRAKDFADKARTAMEDRGASQRSLVEIIHDVANWRAYN